MINDVSGRIRSLGNVGTRGMIDADDNGDWLVVTGKLMRYHIIIYYDETTRNRYNILHFTVSGSVVDESFSFWNVVVGGTLDVRYLNYYIIIVGTTMDADGGIFPLLIGAKFYIDRLEIYRVRSAIWRRRVKCYTTTTIQRGARALLTDAAGLYAVRYSCRYAHYAV